MVKVNPKEIETIRREKLAGFFYDLAKLTFTALVAGIIVQIFTNTNAPASLWFVVGAGICVTIVSAVFGNKLLK